jgi:lysophospholipase L1-like esterase
MFRSKVFAGILTLALVLPVVASAQNVDTGTANFTRYVAIGDSLTAGFSSGGLVATVQVNSYPALIHRQATGTTAGFEQPLVTEPGIPSLLTLQSLAPLRIVPAGGQGAPANLNLQRPYNNLAVPGADIHDVVATVTDNGGLHDLILRRLGTQLQQAVVQQPTFVTIWIGNNDVLAAATSGRVIEGVTLTSVESFEADLRTIVGAIASTGAKMAIANIPSVTSIPFVTTVPSVLVNPATNQPVLVNGNLVPLIGPNGPLGAGDRVLLTGSAELAQGRGIPAALGGSGQPLSDAAVLSASEIATISARVQAYNNIIRSVADSAGAAFVDINGQFNTIATQGLRVGGVTLSQAFLTGGLFSYDGVHPTPFGYAYIANAFIGAINDKFGGEIPLVDFYPFLFGPTPAPTPATAGDFVFTPEATRNLRWSLGIPDSVTSTGKPVRRLHGARRPS